MEKAAVPPSEESTAQRKPSWHGTLDDIWIGRKEEGKDSRGEDHLSDGTALDCLGRAKFSSQGGARLGRSQSAGTWVVFLRWVPETADGVDGSCHRKGYYYGDGDGKLENEQRLVARKESHY
ncbi:hypothetical protein BO79DRAFT_232452 [Aspergillus costaricaensis CBS 115574]|uniref:Uncharacterized protein n=1 Tax=Aspergillus costaricaensis CBS 115574 TaxID=1448317 RepID=A0ACD1I1F7_9EURO|nr:hypothetical protein BO79DRAFT_232452 [Aspergillus costaricaensis CBS 115574]RAK84367.1 hypothetical protein BO79DRAFT_232452 [Aspergillus costaricaensis CBS 115574]